MGNTLEAAVRNGQCEHKWNGGEVTEEPTCLEIGYMTYTCTECGAQRDEYIPAYHNEGSCFKVVSSTVTCTEDGTVTSKCSICGFEKIRNVTAYHNDADFYSYESKNDKVHNVNCTRCGETTSTVEHLWFEFTQAPTCTDKGSMGKYCKICDYTVVTYSFDPTGHSFEDGSCTVCGAPDPEVAPPEPPVPDVIAGDLNGDEKVNAMDINIAKRILSGNIEPTDEQLLAGDVTGDGKFNSFDSNFLSRFVGGAINGFN
jgi:hypothetical protein